MERASGSCKLLPLLTYEQDSSRALSRVAMFEFYELGEFNEFFELVC